MRGRLIVRLSRKEWQRLTTDLLVTEATFDGEVEVKYLPSYRTIRCAYCGHSGRARIPHQTKSPQFKCSRCGRRN